MKMRSYLFWVLLLFLGIGIFFPVIGMLALVCMLAPLFFALSKGRFWCGNACPRGSFYDQVLARVSPNRKIPALFSQPVFRTAILLLIMSVFSRQLYADWGDWPAVGGVFVRIILLTTLVGIVLGLFFHHRTWCAFCPMGTMASWLSRIRRPLPLLVQSSCAGCNACAKSCPMQLTPYMAREWDGNFADGDCLKCSRCVDNCPKKALSFRECG